MDEKSSQATGTYLGIVVNGERSGGGRSEKPVIKLQTAGVSHWGLKGLCQSERYVVWSQFESVVVQGEGVPGRVGVGHFYGDPEAAAISADEEWCVIVGNGVICYRLRPPWRSYSPGSPANGQWWEAGDKSKEILYLGGVRALGGHKFALTTTGWKATEYILDADTQAIEVGREWIDEERKREEEITGDFEDRRLREITVGDGEIHLRFEGEYQMTLHQQVSIRPSPKGPLRVFDLDDEREALEAREWLAKQAGNPVGRLSVDEDGGLDLQLSPTREGYPRSREQAEMFGNPGIPIFIRGVGSNEWQVVTPEGALRGRGGKETAHSRGAELARRWAAEDGKEKKGAGEEKAL